MKKILATLLVVAMVLSLAACGDKNNTTNNTSNNTPAGPVDMTKACSLTMWCIAVETDSNRASYEHAIADMKAKYPNIDFKWEATQNDDYKPKIKAAFQADAVSDIFFTWSCAFLGEFVKAGKVYCLDEAYKEFADKIDMARMCKNTTYDGKKYGVPLTMNIVALFANMDILKSVGYDDVPATYEDLLKCCEALKAKNIIPFGCAAAADQTWCVTEYVEPIIEKACGAKVLDDIFAGNASWDNADVAKAVDIFQDMINKGYFDPDGAGLNNDTVKSNFIAGEYAFYMNGTWNCADFAKEAKLNVKVSEFPVIDSSKSKLGQLIGGPSDTLAVWNGSKNAAVAAKYTLEMGQLLSKYGYLDGCGLPAWKVDYDISNINPLTKKVAEIVNNSDYMVLFGDTAMKAESADKYLKEIAKVYGGEVNGTTFTSDLKNSIK